MTHMKAGLKALFATVRAESVTLIFDRAAGPATVFLWQWRFQIQLLFPK